MSIIHTPLSSSEPQIRLLTLQPGWFDEDIKCSLHTVSLNDNPKYEALSYLWGDENITLPVTVDGSVMRVTTNLEAALRHLRWRETARILWVDAICINQQDVEERNVQVPKMGRIYRNATSVIAWFGHGDENVTTAITWTQCYMLPRTEEAKHEWLVVETMASIHEDGQKHKFFCVFSALIGCLDLCQHDYWSRMWTFQEFALPREVPICLYGRSTFPMSNVIRAGHSLLQYLVDCRSAADNTFKRETETLWSLAQKRYADWNANVTAISKQEIITRRRKPWDDLLLEPAGLDYLLMITAGRKSSDPRDRIYAIYGLHPALSEKFPADYSKPANQVILEAISYLVHTKCYWLWMAFRFRSDRFSSSKAFPSWCPDLDSPHANFRVIKDCGALDFSTSSIDDDKISTDLTTCHLWSWDLGFCKVLGRIDAESHVDKIDSSNLITSLASRLARNLWVFLAGLKAQNNAIAQELPQRFLRLAVSGNIGHEQVSDEELLEALETVSNEAGNSRIENGEYANQAIELLSKTEHNSEGMACVVTSHGCIAFVPIDTEDGDLVVLPRRPTRPIVLRKEHADSRHFGQEFYLMVGPAEIDVMVTRDDHEVDPVSKIRDLGLREYLIH